MIGHKGHPEVEGTMGQLDRGIHLVEDVADVATCSRADGQAGRGHADHAERGRRGRDHRRRAARFPQMRGPKQQDICYATQNRQDAVKFWTPYAGATWCSWSARRTAPTPTACANWPVRRSAVSNWESADGVLPSMQNLLAIAKACRVSLEWLGTGRGGISTDPDAIGRGAGGRCGTGGCRGRTHAAGGLPRAAASIAAVGTRPGRHPAFESPPYGSGLTGQSRPHRWGTAQRPGSSTTSWQGGASAMRSGPA
jgi:hypothetical protein